MTIYCIALSEMPRLEGYDPNLDYFQVKLNSPDLDYDADGHTAFSVPDSLRTLPQDEQIEILLSRLCQVALAESKGGEITDEDAIRWLRYIFYDLHNLPAETTQCEVKLSLLNGDQATLMWDGGGAADIEDASRLFASYIIRLALTEHVKAEATPSPGDGPTPKF